ncbi:hypothetical protein L2E82_10102 [Cichorium intybus]|uniref:Uncharacterized protein n=1 Tax=Cichorium intybus TaxID=13427 RepID=A0ACB9G9P9_CICIN|nr:hypothetical protein L2E82_10102 [Cichorium intybus]
MNEFSRSELSFSVKVAVIENPMDLLRSIEKPLKDRETSAGFSLEGLEDVEDFVWSLYAKSGLACLLWHTTSQLTTNSDFLPAIFLATITMWMVNWGK